MPRRKFIAGNWKMNLNRADGVALAKGIAEAVGTESAVEVALCPPSVYLEAVAGAVKGTAVGVGAQNCYHEPKGAFTGELSPAMLVDIGCRYVILGHSERRQYFAETNGQIAKKLVAAQAAKLIPIVCLGETLPQREANQTFDVIAEQFYGSLAGLTNEQATKLVIAYEPVWAIGTGKTATPAQAEEVHAHLRKLLTTRYNAEVAGQVQIQYGGSVKADNAAEILSQPNVDGALVGGASLVAKDFLAIIAGAKAATK